MTVEDYRELLKGRLDEKRYHHSLCVADEARRLAEKYGGDPDKMYLAGLLHDCTKRMPDDEQLQLFGRFGIILTDVEKASPQIWHAISGSLFVKESLGICDDDIISAIRYHTTGRLGMTLSQKIVYLADLTSADRNYPDVGDIRRLSNVGLNEAIFAVLKFTVNNMSGKGLPLHPDTLDAYNELAVKFKESREEN